MNLQLAGRSMASLNISWLEPQLKNGRLLGFRLNVSLSGADRGRQSRQARPLLTFHVTARPRSAPNLYDDKPYAQLVEGLDAGRGYLVQVAANTSAGFGAALTSVLYTLVAPPVLRGRPSVIPEGTTDSRVELLLPPLQADPAPGAPQPVYLVVVSTDPRFNGSQLQPHAVHNAEESEQRNLTYYITAALGPGQVAGGVPFVVGDGRYYNSSLRAYHNRPLATGSTYRLGVAVLSRVSDDNQRLVFTAVPEPVTVTRYTGSPLLPVLLALFILLVLIIAGFVLYRRRDKLATFRSVRAPQDKAADIPLGGLPQPEVEQNDDVLGNEDEDDGNAIYANLMPPQVDFTRLALESLSERTRTGMMSGVLQTQLEGVPRGLTKPCSHGELAANRRKNRYVNLLPYDDSRVILDKLQGDYFSDYINASYIAGYNRPRAYIACQGPTSGTFFDFWRMVWQEKVRRVVMLTNLVEAGKRKCDKYWPDAEELRLPGLSVACRSTQLFSDYTVRQLAVTCRGQTRLVTHFHYTVWPDHGVPLHPSSLAKFMKVVNDARDGGAPTVVHCSAGVGRTGTVILIDAMYQMGRREGAVDVCSHLAVIRQQRASLCASVAQYHLVHQVLVELLVAPVAAVPAEQLAAQLPQLRAPAADGRSQLQLQLQYLDDHPPAVSFASLRGLCLENKNRTPDVLPEDASRVFLDPTMQDSYVNAVYVQGYKCKDAFIATEAPLPDRKYIFWQMIIQKQTRVIVIMDDLDSEDVFWPNEEQPDVYSNIEVQRKNSTVSDSTTTMNLKISCLGAGKMVTQEVCVLLLRDGAGRQPPCSLPSAAALFQLHSGYMRAAATASAHSPVVVVCRDGVSGCGLFLTVCLTLEYLSEEQQLDVMTAVSIVRRSRHQFITGLEQYELCHDVALSWLEAFATYANFQ